MTARQRTILPLLVVATASLAQASLMVFTDVNAWQAAVGSSASDNFASAVIGGPQKSYVSPLGVTLRRSTVFENNGQSRTTTTGYDGDLQINEPPYIFQSSPNQVFISSFGPMPGENTFAGVENSYSRIDGSEEARLTRVSDRARKRVRTEYDDSINRNSAQITGKFEDAVFGFGFSLTGSAGPYPATLRLAVDGQAAAVPLLGFTPGMFFGVVSTTPIDDFRFSVSRGTLVHSTETYTNRACFGGPSEVCLANGSIDRWFSSARADITRLFVATGAVDDSTAASDDILSTPEPHTGIAVLTGIAALWLSRRRSS
jgi:hypothetical protein